MERPVITNKRYGGDTHIFHNDLWDDDNMKYINHIEEQNQELREYAKHKHGCSWLNNGGGNCDCGLIKLLKQ